MIYWPISFSPSSMESGTKIDVCSKMHETEAKGGSSAVAAHVSKIVSSSRSEMCSPSSSGPALYPKRVAVSLGLVLMQSLVGGGAEADGTLVAAQEARPKAQKALSSSLHQLPSCDFDSIGFAFYRIRVSLSGWLVCIYIWDCSSKIDVAF